MSSSTSSSLAAATNELSLPTTNLVMTSSFSSSSSSAPQPSLHLNEQGVAQLAAGNYIGAKDLFTTAISMDGEACQLTHMEVHHLAYQSSSTTTINKVDFCGVRLIGDNPLIKNVDTRQQAVERWEKARKAVLLSNRAVCYLKLNQPLLAFYDTQASLALNPTHYAAAYLQADALFQMKKYKEAKSACVQGVEMKMDRSLVVKFIELGQSIEKRLHVASSIALSSSQSSSIAASSQTYSTISSFSAPSLATSLIAIASSSSSSASSSSEWPSTAAFSAFDWMEEAEGQRRKREEAISHYTRALHLDAKTEIESKLLISLLSHISAYYAYMANTAMNDSKNVPSHTDILNALNYGVAAYAIDATSTESLLSAFSLLTRYFLLGFCDSPLLASIMNSIVQPISDRWMSRLILRYLLVEQGTHPLDRSAPLVKLRKDGEFMTMSNAAQLLKQGEALNKHGKSHEAIQLWMRALTLFVPRAELLANRGKCCFFLDNQAPLQAALDIHAAFLLLERNSYSDTWSQFMYSQAGALFRLQEYEASAAVCRLAIKFKKDGLRKKKLPKKDEFKLFLMMIDETVNDVDHEVCEAVDSPTFSSFSSLTLFNIFTPTLFSSYGTDCLMREV